MKKFIFGLIGFLCATPAFAQVSATGVGTVFAKPDCANVVFAAHTESATAQVAHSNNRTMTNSLWTVFKKHKIAEKDISTSDFGIHRVFDKDAKQTGFLVYHRINVTVNDLTDLGSLIDDGVATGCDLSTVSFQIKDRAELEKQARDLAIATAKAKAEQMCKGFGVTLGVIKECTDNVRYLTPTYRMTMPGRESSSKVAPGEQGITVQVMATWNITPTK